MKRLVALILAVFACISISFAAVNVNTATDAELQSLNGIGPVKAKAIIDYRAKHGPFKAVEELDNVPGIGQGTLGKIRKDVTLTGQTTVSAEAKRADKRGASGAKKSGPSADGVKDAKKESEPAATAKRETKGDTVTRAGTSSGSKKGEDLKAAQDDKAHKKDTTNEKTVRASTDDSAKAAADSAQKRKRSKKDEAKPETVK